MKWSDYQETPVFRNRSLILEETAKISLLQKLGINPKKARVFLASRRSRI